MHFPEVATLQPILQIYDVRLRQTQRGVHTACAGNDTVFEGQLSLLTRLLRPIREHNVQGVFEVTRGLPHFLRKTGEILVVRVHYHSSGKCNLTFVLGCNLGTSVTAPLIPALAQIDYEGDGLLWCRVDGS